MTIGINAAAALKQPRTGVEEYTYQLIKHLTMLPEAREHRFFLFVPNLPKEGFGFPLPENFIVKKLNWPLPFLWTQIRLALEMLFKSPDILFVPVHILPFFHPKKSVVAIHGLEYEYWPQCYSFFRRWYLRWSTKSALKRARRIITISENTKDDLLKLYGGDAGKIEAVLHGVSKPEVKIKMKNINEPYLLYLGRIETKKNIRGILEAYEILKEKYKLPHKLILAGAPGYGYGNLKFKIKNLKLKIIELGYVSEDEKWQLLLNADIFLFPSFYEGFGLPVLEAQAAGAPVITSDNSCLPEVAGEGALLVNPQNPAQIAKAAIAIIDDKVLRDRLIQLGYENVKRFSWEKCARETLNILK